MSGPGPGSGPGPAPGPGAGADPSALAFAPRWPAPAAVRACVTQRAGGTSSGPYSSLNLGAHVGDDPARVAENRRRLIEVSPLPAAPRWLEQVHGTTVIDWDEAPVHYGPEATTSVSRPVGRGGVRAAHRHPSNPPLADGAVTGRPGIVCAVLTADCLPVLLCDRDGRRVGVAHAGWRGLAAGVLPAAVAAMGLPPARLLAWLGPAIGRERYEVGDEVRAAFRDLPGGAAAFERNPRGRWQADLYALARASLRQAGVDEIHGGGFCTYREASRFFSHRREAPCGRMASLIWLVG